MWVNRLRNVQSLMEKTGVECLFISPGPNLRYLTGFYFPFPGDAWDEVITWDSFPVGIIPLDGDLVLVVSNSSEEWVRAITHIEDIRCYSSAENRIVIFKDLIDKANGTLGIEEHLPFKIYEQLAASFPQIQIKNASAVLSEVRLIKSEEEIAAIRKAVSIVEKGIRAGRELLQESITEKEIANEIKSTMQKAGAEDIPYYLVQTGANAAAFYPPPSETRVKKGDFVLMDIVAAYKGCHADITRMTVVGKPIEKKKRVYQVILNAQMKALEAIRDGVKAGVINDVGMKVIDEGGYDKYVIHGIGHGLGFESHEIPSLAKDREMVLQTGMVITIEPGVYLPGEFGIRIEDDVLVTDGGKEVITTLGNELVQI